MYFYVNCTSTRGFPGGAVVKNPPANAGDVVGKIPWRRKWQPTPIFLPGKFYGQMSLAGYNPWCYKKLDMTEHTHAYLNEVVKK